MTNEFTPTMTIIELVYEGVKMYIDRNGWSWHDGDATSIIAEDIHEAFGVMIDYSIIDDVINTKLNIETTATVAFA